MRKKPSVQKPAEVEDHERKSNYYGTLEDRAQLVKTIVAMANTKGGTIVLKTVHCNRDDLDSARLDDLVNRYVARRVRGISSRQMLDGSIEIHVVESENKPHVFRCNLPYKDKRKRTVIAFHEGQVWVRHSSKNEPATIDDIEQILREMISIFLGGLGEKVLQPSFSLQAPDAKKVPVRLSDEADATPITPDDLEKLYPYTTKQLGITLGKNQNWAARAVKVLGLKESREYSYSLKISKNSRHYIYSEKALQRIQNELGRDSDWNPYRVNH